MAELSYSYALVPAVFIILFIYSTSRPKTGQRSPLPPGPKGYPIIGNLLDIPRGYDPRVWAGFKNKYGM